MSLLFLVVTLCTGSAMSQVQVPCYGKGCANVTVYLGPRWGSRVIIVPKGTGTIPSVVNSTESDGVSENSLEIDERYHRPQHKPITQDKEFRVDFMDDERPSPIIQIPFRGTGGTRRTTTGSKEQPWWRLETTTMRRLPEFTANYPIHKVQLSTDKFGRGTVDLSWRGYTGEEVKQALKTLTQYERQKVTKLILDGNKIQLLPVLVFPVELEYELQELSLADNSFSPPYLTRYSRFELSRLGRLGTLNMSRCGLRSIEMPDLPSLSVLDLNYNELTYLPSSLGRLNGLQQLFLRGNRLEYISDSPFSSFQYLWVLDLGSNGLKEVWNDALGNLVSLNTLKLDNNKLTSMPQLNTVRKKIVSLANNSLICSCSLLHQVEYYNIQIGGRGRYSQGLFMEHNAMCETTYGTILLPDLMKWPDKYQYLCDQEKWWSSESLAKWYRRNNHIMTAIYKLLGLMVVVVVLVALHRRRQKIMAKVKPQGVPYSMLDEQKVSTVSVPHSVP